ncbi:hypothetical protein BJX64DRAFT_259531 [Aspergillus heterothallicus]
MKSPISPDIWENKRLLITKLYKDEEWPLKQVIKLVQTNDFHPSESQLRSRLKKWHITKPSRKKYDGSRRLSGAKKNAIQKRQSESQSFLPPSAAYNTLQSHPEESDEARSEISRPSVSIPDMSASPNGQYILPSSPVYDEALYGPNPAMAPSTPITPAFYGMDEPKRTSDAGHPIYFCAPDMSSSSSEYPVSNTITIPAHHASHGHFGSFSEPSPMIGDSLGYQGVPYIAPHHKHQPDGPFGMAGLPSPLLDGAHMATWAFDLHNEPPSPTAIYPHSHPHPHPHPHSHPHAFFHHEPIYQIM